MRSIVCMLVEIPEDTVDDDTLEELLLAAIEDYSLELAKRINLCIDGSGDDCDACNEMAEEENEEDENVEEGEEVEEDEEDEFDDEEDEEDELYERCLVLSANGIRPDEAHTVVALIGQVVEDSRFGIAGTVLDDCYDEESAESLGDDEDVDEDWDIRDN